MTVSDLEMGKTWYFFSFPVIISSNSGKLGTDLKRGNDSPGVPWHQACGEGGFSVLPSALTIQLPQYAIGVNYTYLKIDPGEEY